MSLTFKQYYAYLEAPLDETSQINELWLFKNQKEKEKAERQKLELLVKRGDLKAKAKLDALEKTERIASATKKNIEKEKDQRFATAKAHIEARDRGSSRAYDNETGSLSRNQTPHWSHEHNKWIKPGEDAWAHVGKHH